MKDYGCTSVQELIELCEQTVGYLEKKDGSELGDLFTELGKTINAGTNNYTIVAKYYKELTGENYQGQAWCAMFVSVMFALAFGKDKAKQLLNGKFYSYCPYIYNNFNSCQAIDAKFAEPGDIIDFYSSSLGRYSHTGIVVQVNADGSFITIEGNTGSGNDIVIRNGGCVAKKFYSKIPAKAVFCRPDWKKYGILFGGKLSVDTYAIKGTLTLLADTPLRDEYGNVILTMEAGCACVASKKIFQGSKRLYYVCYKHKYGYADPSHMKGWIQELDDDNKWWYLLDNYKWYSGCIVSIGDKPFIFNDAGYCVTNEDIMIHADCDGYLSVSNQQSLT